MAQDFAKKKNASSPKKSGSSGIPGWVWLITGVITGAFVMFLIYLTGIGPPKAGKNPADPVAQDSSDNTDKNANPEKPTFEFYDSLTNNEVIPTKPAGKDSSTTQSTSASTYLLQAASFQKATDADALKAKLILEGLDTHIEKFNNKGNIWYRVLVGPFTDQTKIAQAKAKLAQHNISPIVLQKKP